MMFQLAALPISANTGVLPEGLTEHGAESVNSGVFAELLALQQGQATSAPEAVGTSAMPLVAMQRLPAGGKSLPPGKMLPSIPAVGEDHVPETAEAAVGSEPEKEFPIAEQNARPLPVAIVVPVLASVAAPVPTVVVTPQRDATARPVTASPRQATSAKVQPTDQNPVAPNLPQLASAVPAAFVPPVQPEPVRHLHANPEEHRPATTGEQITEAPTLPGPAPTHAAQFTTPNTPAIAAAPAPHRHDFAALVDRLIEARDAAQPQPVQLAVAHAEFGEVSVKFRHGESGLTVSLASPDPDFARAVHAAAPNERQATTGDNASGQPSAQRQDGSPTQSQNQSQSQPQARGGEAREPRSAATARTANQASTHPGEKPARSRGGIFA